MPIEAEERFVIFKQFYLNCLAHASYLIGDEETRIAAVVDPQRDVDRYVEFAGDHKLRIAHVILTHLHADFIAGHLELRDRAGATIYLGAKALAEYEFTALHDGSVVEFGRVRLQALETPGHTPESISIVVYDLERSNSKAHAVLTGDTLFVGDVGRPDLRVALGWSAADLGGLLFDSLQSIAGRKPGVSGAWRRVTMRKSNQQGNGVHHGRAAAGELRAAADEQTGIHRTGDRGPA